MLKTHFVQTLCFGFVVTVLSLVGTPAAFAETYNARCYHSSDKDSGYDKCSISLNEQALQIDYENEDLKKNNVSINIKNIVGFTDSEISKVDAGRVFLLGIAGVFWKKKYSEYTVNYINPENGKQFIIFQMRDKRASAFKAQLSNLSSPESSSATRLLEPSAPVTETIPTPQPSPVLSPQVLQ